MIPLSLAAFAANMHPIDWCIVLGLLVVIFAAAISTKKYTQSVADFLAANRCAGRYLLCISQGIAGLGAISVVAFFEMYYSAGFTANWWLMMWTPLALLIALSGFVIYRYRETRVMTMAQFFEVRYSKGVRVFAGILGWVAGILNFGIFPAVGARFFIHFCGIPLYHVSVFGTEVELVYPGIMLFLLSVSLFFVFLGGQIAVMVTDFIQGVFTNIVFLIIVIVVFWMFDWSSIIEALKTAPEDASRIHPYHTGKVDGFTPFYFLIGAMTLVYGWKAWQGSQGYLVSARTAHEAKMAGILGEWRGLVFTVVIMMLPIGAYVIMRHAAYSGVVEEVDMVLQGIDSEQIRDQMTVPVVLAKSLPVGIVGLLCATMLAAFVSTHDTYLHSWGSMFIQDVILPFRKKPFTPKQHMLLLRLSIVFVAVFIFFFSLYFAQNDQIFMFFAMTGAIYIGGAGSLIVGGLYWKHGSTAGAWVALTVGSAIAIGGMVLRLGWPTIFYPLMENHAPWLIELLRNILEGIAASVSGINWEVGPDEFALNGQWISFFAMSLAITGYIMCSLYDWLVRKRPAFNMGRMLHRGEYAITGEHEGDVVKPVAGLRAILPSEEFSFSDKCIYYAKLIWTIGWFSVFAFGTIHYIGSRYGWWADFSDDAWVTFWAWRIGIVVVLGAGTTVWFLIGGLIDTRKLFKTLAEMKRDHADMGIVTKQTDDGEPQPAESDVKTTDTTAQSQHNQEPTR